MTEQQPDDHGFTLIELLLVIVVLGLLATIVVFAVDGVSAKAEAVGCEADRRALYDATQAYLVRRNVDVIPAADATPDGVENTLVAAGFLRSPSTYHDVDATGRLVQVAGSPCLV